MDQLIDLYAECSTVIGTINEHNRVFSKVFTVITVISQTNAGTTENDK